MCHFIKTAFLPEIHIIHVIYIIDFPYRSNKFQNAAQQVERNQSCQRSADRRDSCLIPAREKCDFITFILFNAYSNFAGTIWEKREKEQCIVFQKKEI